MNEYMKEITDSLQANPIIQSLTLFSVGKIGVESIMAVLMNNITLKRLTLSWQTRSSIYNRREAQIHTLFLPNTDDAVHTKIKLNDTNNVVNVNISCDVYISYRFSLPR